MGTGAHGGGDGRARRRAATLAAAATGATIAAAVAAHRRRRRGPGGAAAQPAAVPEVVPPKAETDPVPADPIGGTGARAATTPAATAPGGDTAPTGTHPGVTTPGPPARHDARPDVAAAGFSTAPGVPPAVPPTGDAAGRPPSAAARRPRWVPLAGGVALAVVVGVGAVLAGGAGGSDPGTPGTSTPPAPETTSTVVITDPALAFATAAERLNVAGSFTYTGTASATDISPVRPMLWLEVGLTVEGQVATTTAGLHEVAVAGDGQASETVAVGPQVWGRRAGTRDGLAQQPFEALPLLSGDPRPARGAALLPAWLSAVTDPAVIDPDEQGRRRYQGNLPAEVLGQIDRTLAPAPATVVLTLDGTGAPARVEVATPPEGRPLHLVLDLTALGAPVEIGPPA